MDSEYRFDYEKAKPNRFAEKMNLNVGWTVEGFVASANGKSPSPNGKSTTSAKKTTPAKKAKASLVKKPAPKKTTAKTKTPKKKGKK